MKLIGRFRNLLYGDQRQKEKLVVEQIVDVFIRDFGEGGRAGLFDLLNKSFEDQRELFGRLLYAKTNKTKA